MHKMSPLGSEGGQGLVAGWLGGLVVWPLAPTSALAALPSAGCSTNAKNCACYADRKQWLNALEPNGRLHVDYDYQNNIGLWKEAESWKAPIGQS